MPHLWCRQKTGGRIAMSFRDMEILASQRRCTGYVRRSKVPTQFPTGFLRRVLVDASDGVVITEREMIGMGIHIREEVVYPNCPGIRRIIE